LKLGDGEVARDQPLEQPDQLQVAPAPTFQTPGAPHPVGIAVKIKLEQRSGII